MAKGDQLQPKALRDRKREDLVEELLKLRREQFNLRVQQAVGQLTRSDQVRKVRRNIARELIENLIRGHAGLWKRFVEQLHQVIRRGARGNRRRIQTTRMIANQFGDSVT